MGTTRKGKVRYFMGGNRPLNHQNLNNIGALKYLLLSVILGLNFESDLGEWSQ